MKVADVIDKAVRGELRWLDAAQILGLSDRQLRRWRLRLQAAGPDGLRDARQGRVPANHVPEATAARVLDLYRTQYAGFNVRHFWEHLGEEHGLTVSYSWTKALLQAAGAVARAAPRGRYRRRRDRKPMRGLLLHLDASKHAWFATPDGALQDLLAVLDDATGEIVAAQFVPEESTQTVLAILREVVATRGTFAALYTDRASHFAYTPVAGQAPDRTRKTQVERVLDELGIELICAHSPQARGRSERLWRTLQGRLPAELARVGATTYEAANAYLRTPFVARFNRRFAVAPQLEGTAFVPTRGVDLDGVFAWRFTRQVRNDHTIRFQNRVLQLPKVGSLCAYAGRTVQLRLTLDGRLDVLLGARRLQSFAPNFDLTDAALDAA